MKEVVRVVAGSVLAVTLGGTSIRAQAPPPPMDKLEITAFAVNMNNIAGASAVVDITVTSWSSAEERTRLISTVLEKGNDALLRELQNAPAKGRIRIPAAKPPDPHHLALGLDLRYAWQTPLPDGGTRIVLGTDRYIGFEEARRQPRTIDYPFSLIEIHVDKNGKGQGKFAVATKIEFDKKNNQIQLENYGIEPVRLTTVTVKKKS